MVLKKKINHSASDSKEKMPETLSFNEMIDFTIYMLAISSASQQIRFIFR